MNTKNISATATTARVKPATQSSGSETGGSGLIVKIAIPLVLALVAAMLNATAVARQMKTQAFLTYKQDLTIGHEVTDEDLVEVKLGGDVGQVPYILNTEAAKSELTGRVLNRPVKQGELVVETQFGGISIPGVELVPQELTKDESRNLGQSPRPGQWFYVKYVVREDEGKTFRLGPFQVAPVDKSYRTDSSDSVTVLNLPRDKTADRQIFTLKKILSSGQSGKYDHVVELLASAPSIQITSPTSAIEDADGNRPHGSNDK
jgi:hypothetical protein